MTVHELMRARVAQRGPKCAHSRCSERTDVLGSTCPLCTEGLVCDHCHALNLPEADREARSRMLASGELDAHTYVQVQLLESFAERPIPLEMLRALIKAPDMLLVHLCHWLHQATVQRAERALRGDL